MQYKVVFGGPGKDTHKCVPISSIKEIWAIEEDDDMRFHRPHPRNPLVDGWICPYCGKRVYSMEVHSCNQPYCGAYYGKL